MTELTQPSEATQPTQKPFKTLHFTNSWHETSGGIATFYRAMIAAANKRGHHLALVVPGPRDESANSAEHATQFRVEQTGPTTRIYHVAAPASPLNPGYRTIYPNQFLWPHSPIQRILSQEKPDVVEICDKYTFNYLGAVLRLGLLPGIDFKPLVLGLSCERMDENVAAYLSHGPLARWLAAFYMRWLYFPLFDHHLVNSTYTAEELSIAAHGHAVRRGVWVMPMGVDFAGFSPELRCPAARLELTTRCGIPPDSTLLLYAGRLVPEKNLGLLIDTIESLARQYPHRNYHLLIAGQGIAQAILQGQAETRVPGRVHFFGHLPDRQQLASLYANSDVFVHPNPREPFGIGPLEAMASGLPLVAPNAGGVLTYANAENAWIAPPDAASFSAAIEAVLSDPATRAARTQRARTTASGYQWEPIAQRFLNLYQALYAASVDDAEPLVHQTRLPQASSPTLEAPYLWSTPPTAETGFIARTIANIAKRTFRIVNGLRTQPHAPTSTAAPTSPDNPATAGA
jgi:alpha-1,6-mannosyltransferase